MLKNTLNSVKVSVVMPVYNVEKFVADAIESILAQTYTDFELLIINDCSPDNSLAVCQQYNDPRIRIINHQKNRGLAGARNTGIRHAKGEFIGFIDSDDLWDAEKIAHHVKHLEQNPTIGLSFSRSEFIETNGFKTGYYQMPKLKSLTTSEILCRNPVGNGSAPIIRRSVFDHIGYRDINTHDTFYFNERLRRSEDIECWVRIALTTNWTIEGIPQALTYYRLNEGGLSASLFSQYESWEHVIELTRLYSPGFIDQWGQIAKAYQLRYLARQAIRLRNGEMAVKFINTALRADPSILYLETARTLATMTAAYLLYLMPKSIYLRMESLGCRFVSKLHKLRIRRDLQTAI